MAKHAVRDDQTDGVGRDIADGACLLISGGPRQLAVAQDRRRSMNSSTIPYQSAVCIMRCYADFRARYYGDSANGMLGWDFFLSPLGTL